MRVGIIGAGGISGAHYRGYVASGAEVVAAADVNETTLKARQKEWGLEHIFTDHEALLALPDLEAVSVATPNAYHHAAVLAAARAGKHVLCEKPISLNLDQAAEMIRACDEAGVVLQIGHHMRSNMAAQRAKAMIDSGELGRVTFMRLRQAHDWAGAEVVRGVFGSKAGSGGGTLLDNGCHMFDLARYFAGNVAEVYARTATLKFEVEVEDTALVSLLFESGTLASVENGWTATGWEEGFWIYGTKGALEYTNRWGPAQLKHRFRDSPMSTWGGTDVATYDFFANGVQVENHTLHIRNFLAAIRGERDVICTGEDGLKAVRLALAAYESAETNAPVKPDDVFHLA
jgi:predicted dehydrogenase